ncbi:MAG: pentapeptide repeat-containing protein, partial [Bacteroidetes bacterium]|nr:pentapeptide repeat-containing protein [Bacteroidota bacterium]
MQAIQCLQCSFNLLLNSLFPCLFFSSWLRLNDFCLLFYRSFLRCRFPGCNFLYCRFLGCRLPGCNFLYCRFLGCRLPGCNLLYCRFLGC